MVIHGDLTNNGNSNGILPSIICYIAGYCKLYHHLQTCLFLFAKFASLLHVSSIQFLYIVCTVWLFNVAMENHHF